MLNCKILNTQDGIVKLMAYILCFGMCLQRISIAVGNICLAVATLLFLWITVKNKIYLTKFNQNKKYYQAWIILFVSMIPSVIFSYDSILSTKALFDMWVYRMMPFFILISLSKEKEVLEKIVIALLSVTTIESVFAIGQVAAGITDRGYGFGYEPNGLAALIAVVFPIALVSACDENISGNIKKVALFAMPILLLGAIAGQARALWLTLIVVSPFILYRYVMRSKKALMVVTALSCALVMLFVFNASLKERFISSVNVTTNVSNTDRIVLWKSSWNMIKDHPITGVGIRCYGPIYKERYMLDEMKQKHIDQSHNNFVQICSETGVLGFLGFLGFTIFMIFTSWIDWYKKYNPYALMCFGAWLSFTLVGMTGATIQASNASKLLWFISGLLIALKNLWNKKD